jgi:cytochrome c-type biogenesis protein CcmH/NrfF
MERKAIRCPACRNQSLTVEAGTISNTLTAQCSKCGFVEVCGD